MSGFAPGEWEWILESSDFDKDDGFFISNDLKPVLQRSNAAKKADQTLGRMDKTLISLCPPHAVQT